MFIPDPGYTIFEADFKQADARVVAWDSGCERLKALFRDPTVDIHNENAKAIYGTVTKIYRQLAKGGVHAVNYGVLCRTLAKTLGISEREAQAFIDKWFAQNPEVKEWQEATKDKLLSTGTIHNIWGFRLQYFDRVDHKLPEALAWIGQSTVAIAAKKAMNNLMRNLEDPMPDAFQILMQNHDSIIGQFRSELYRDIRVKIRNEMRVTVPYADPLVMECDIKASRISWGHCKEIPWEDEQKFCIH